MVAFAGLVIVVGVVIVGVTAGVLDLGTVRAPKLVCKLNTFPALWHGVVTKSPPRLAVALLYADGFPVR